MPERQKSDFLHGVCGPFEAKKRRTKSAMIVSIRSDCYSYFLS